VDDQGEVGAQGGVTKEIERSNFDKFRYFQFHFAYSRQFISLQLLLVYPITPRQVAHWTTPSLVVANLHTQSLSITFIVH